MIIFSNGRKAQFFIASGALAFDGKGWFWEKPLIWLGLIKPELFTVVLKSLTLEPRKGNLRWWKPWECVKLIERGVVNKIGLTNKGFDWWLEEVAPKLDFSNNLVVSLFGTHEEIMQMLPRLDLFDVTAVELNESCPNSGHSSEAATMIIAGTKECRKVSRHPFIIKLSYEMDCIAIAKGLEGVVEAVSINSVKWETVFPNEPSPLWRLEEKVKGGGGGVSGYAAQAFNWNILYRLAKETTVKIIAPSIMEYEDLQRVRDMGSSAESFGAIHLPTKGKPWTLFSNPCKPTKIVRRDRLNEQAKESYNLH